jgi:hypothetical protein
MGVDVARGLAMIGMIGAHVAVTEAFDWARIETWTDLVHGRSSILFAIVAGISIALMTGGSGGIGSRDIRDVRLRLVGRGAAIFLIGLVLEMLGTGVAVILTFYGVLFIAVIPFVRWRRRRLLVSALVLAVLGPPLFAAVKTVAWNASGGGVDLMLTGSYSVVVWLVLLLLGLAVGRSRLDRIRTAVVLACVGIVMSVAGYGVGALADSLPPADAVVSGVDEGSADSSSSSSGQIITVAPEDVDYSGLVCDVAPDRWVTCYPESLLSSKEESSASEPGSDFAMEHPTFDDYAEVIVSVDPLTHVLADMLVASPHSGGTAEIFGSGGLGLAVIGLCLLIARPLRWVLLPVAALGSMPLSAYSAHIVVIFIVQGMTGASSSNSLWFGLSGGLLVAATLWAHIVGRGPLERVVARTADAFAGGQPDRRGARPVGSPARLVD